VTLTVLRADGGDTSPHRRISPSAPSPSWISLLAVLDAHGASVLVAAAAASAVFFAAALGFPASIRL